MTHHRHTSNQTMLRGLLFAMLAGGVIVAGCGESEATLHRDIDDAQGADCLADGDCPEGSVCHETGVCVETCMVDDDCASNEICEAERCVVQTTDDCEQPCPDQMGCVHGTCLWQCEVNAECPTMYQCASGYCQPGGCTQHSDCAEGQGCFKGGCLEADCRENAECPDDQLCGLGACTTAPECVVDSNCRGGQTCVEGVCEGTPSGGGGGVPSVCETNRDCAERQYCIGGECHFSIECLAHGHCPTGQACFNKLCWEL